MANGAGEDKSRRIEVNANVPSVIVGMGSLVVIVLGCLVTLPLAFLFGYGTQGVFVAFLAGILGSFAGIGYFLYRPVNPFSNNAYAPKFITKLTPDELRALTFLNTRDGQSIAILISLGVALIPALGALSWRQGLVITPHLAQEKPFNMALWIITLTLCGPATIVNYLSIICRVLWKRWDWIRENQPLPSRKILAKYAKGTPISAFDNLCSTDYINEKENEHQELPASFYLGWLLQISGILLAVLFVRHIIEDAFRGSQILPSILVLLLCVATMVAGKRIRCEADGGRGSRSQDRGQDRGRTDGSNIDPGG